ncbi:Type I restriction-modification system, specificity subunit S [Azospirillum argentinense]|uniref:restriction endonuclease subunit S n=1 Tax=Azospirillum argentinense TaxID=2970906 RepID=UPI0032E00CA2
MNAERLLALYERIADASDGVQRLRRFILDLAVRGKLVPQDPNDGSASAVMKGRHVPTCTRGPFDCPSSWVWVRVRNVAETRLGKMLDKAKNKGIPRPYLRNVNVRWFDFDLSDLLEMPFTDGELTEFELRCGDVLICEGGEPGRASVWDERTCGIYFQKAIHRVRLIEDVNPYFFVKALRASADDGRLAEYFTGTGIKHFTGKGLGTYLFPLPPLAEQHRIVAKVDELMALCDQLEKAREQREAKRDRFTAATLARLNAPEPETFHEDAKLVLGALTALTTRPDQIKQLRQTILNLAVQGKLVQQKPTDEPISAALRKAVERRTSLARRGRRKAGGSGDPLPSAELPSGWALEVLGNLVDPENAISYGVLVPGDDVPGGIPFVRAQDLVLSSHPERPSKTISPDVEKAYARTRLRGGEILLCVVGSIGKLGTVPEAWAGANIARAVARILPIQEISREYLLIALRSDQVQSCFKEATRTLAQPTLNIGLIEQTTIPLPPLAEQRRIVAKVDELMLLCEQLEASLTNGDNTRVRLLDALLVEALAPVKDREMQAAE